MALAALLVAYLVYARLSGTPGIELDVPGPLPGPQVAGARDGREDPIGTIAGVGIGALERPRFFHTNEQQQVDREMGFEELLHKEGDQWEITNPFMRLFLPEFRCDVTADRGTFQLETAFGRPMPNDAVFEGNVVIHIVPPEPNDPMESFIYLDDVAFVADKSLFSSSGSVRFLSRSAALEGTGLELLYDSTRSRLELFRIVDLDALRLRSAEFGALSSLTSPQRETPTTDAAATTSDADVTLAAAAQPSRDFDAGDANEPNGPPPELYRCVFYRNVVIDAPEQLIVAREQLSINDILWSQSNEKDKDKGDAGEEAVATAEPNLPAPLPIPGPNALDTTPSPQLAFDALSEDLYDIVVTCDGGFVVAPTDAPAAFADPCAVTPAPGAQPQPPEVAAADSGQRALARRIDYHVPTADTTLAGPVELTLYVDPNGLGGRAAPSEPVPMHITARKMVRFMAASNQVLFEGDCVATVEQVEPDARYQHTLMAPRFTLDLAVARADKASEPTVLLQRFAAHGGPVSLVVLKRAGDELIGWTGFEASRMDYEASRRLFTAYGPGVVALHNARAAEPPPDPNQISFDRPCYARMRDFDLLTYSAQTNKIIAEAGAQPIRIDYVPVDDGVPGEGMHADAGYFEVTLRTGDDGRAQLDWLSAADGITYWDEKNRFAGGRLTYDHNQALMLIAGDSTQPCYLNGALVDEIEWNLKTGHLKAPFSESSVVQVAQ